jgi:ATP-dependent 26S proteasome regulatory subunit
MLQQQIDEDLRALERFIYERIKGYFAQDESEIFLGIGLHTAGTPYADFLDLHAFNYDERLVLLLALASEISTHSLDPFLTKNSLYDLSYTEFGGYKNSDSAGFIPTLQTALFLLCAGDTQKVLEKRKLFNESGKLFQSGILASKERDALGMDMRLVLSKNTLHTILALEEHAYDYAKEFPAQLLKSNYEWSDLVFSQFTKEHLAELEMWLTHQNVLLGEWGMQKSLKKGYKALFYGPPGTGKSLTATLLGKKIGKDVYRIDLSQIVSKYIGETEKNLEKVFNQAAQEDWILFFDEADSLFGKRTQVNSSNDRYANQGTSYLLQRIDDCENMIILASNYKDNFDEAYLRRFQSIIYFPLPEYEERLALWQKGFSPKASLSTIDLAEIAYEYELSGSTIMNVIRYASLMAISRDANEIFQEDIIKGIRREKFKEGKLV